MDNRKNFNKKSDGGKVQNFVVDEPIGLLDFLFENMKGKGVNKVKSTLKYRLVSVDGKVTTQFDYPLRKGQVVSIASYKPEYKRDNTPDMPDIIYEDDNIIVVNKPAGMLAVATDEEKENTAYHAVTEYVKRRNRNDRIFIVHRLDRDTSGILLFAKNDAVKFDLQEHWNDYVKYRGYCAVVEGHPDPKQGRIESWLKETDSMFVYSSRTKGDGKLSITNYEVKRESRDYSLVAVNIETGRKNQIRAHFSEMGCPIAGDKKYGAETNPIRRLALHADRLVIYIPHLGREMEWKLPVPQKFLSMMKHEDEYKKKGGKNNVRKDKAL